MIFRKCKQYVTIIHIPDGFSVLTLPKDFNISNVLIDITYKTQYIDDKTLKIEASYTLKNDVYDSRYYQSLKGLFSVAIEKFNEKVVLAKK